MFHLFRKNTEQHRKKYMDMPNIREFRKKNNLCYFCGNVIDLPSGNICSKCQENFRKNGRKHGGKHLLERTKQVDFWR